MPLNWISRAARSRLITAAACALVLGAGALLAVGAFLGRYVRPTSDDWCGAWKTRDLGLAGITRDFYDTQNGRAANALVTGVVYSRGLIGPEVLPMALVVTLGLGLVLLARMLGQRLAWRAPAPVVLAAALVVETLLFFAGTRSYQVLLWAPGTISHTLPGVIGVWSVLVAAAAGRRGGRAVTWTAVGYAVLMGAVVGTLSEPFTVVSGVFAGTAGACLLVPRLRARTWYPFTWCAAWCAGLGAGFTALYTSPGARLRRAQEPSAGSPLSGRVLRADLSDWLHVWHSIAGTWAYLAAPAVGLVLGLAVSVPSYRDQSPSGGTGSGSSVAPGRRERGVAGESGVLAVPGHRWGRTVLLTLPALLVVVSSFGVVAGLRMGYGPAGWTYGRAWTNFLLPMIAVLVGYGALLGRWFAVRLDSRGSRWKPPAALGVALAALATCGGACLQVVPAVQGMARASVTRELAWDRQDALIREAAAAGDTAVTYHPLRIGGLAEPFFTRTYARDWVAGCVARYYRVDRVVRQSPPLAPQNGK